MSSNNYIAKQSTLHEIQNKLESVAKNEDMELIEQIVHNGFDVFDGNFSSKIIRSKLTSTSTISISGNGVLHIMSEAAVYVSEVDGLSTGYVAGNTGVQYGIFYISSQQGIVPFSKSIKFCAPNAAWDSEVNYIVYLR